MSFSLLRISADRVRSLSWDGDLIVDALRGVRWSLDGTCEHFASEVDPAFDAALSSGPYSVTYERLGTRASLRFEGRHLRTLTRDDYHADAYEYPVCMWRTRTGRTLLAHCPESYARIEIEDAETGKRLTASDDRTPSDFFHSRLAVDPSGTRMLSAGWVWHPVDVVGYVELAAALEDPRQLDALQDGVQADGLSVEEGSACWQHAFRMLVGGNDDPHVPVTDATSLPANGIAVYDVRHKRVVSSVSLGFTPGTMMPVGDDKVVTFYAYPRLVSLTTGSVLASWPELPSGEQASSIIHHIDLPPPLALDPVRRRFAVARGDEIVVVSLEGA